MLDGGSKSAIRSFTVAALFALAIAAFALAVPAWADEGVAGAPAAEADELALDESGATEAPEPAFVDSGVEQDAETDSDELASGEPVAVEADELEVDEQASASDKLAADEPAPTVDVAAIAADEPLPAAAEPASAESVAVEPAGAQAAVPAEPAAVALVVQDSAAIASGTYTIKTTAAYGQALGNSGSYSANAAVKSYAVDGAYDQIFQFQQAANGLFSIFSAHSGLALTVSGGKVVQAAYSGSNAQLFEVRSVGKFFALISQAGAITAAASSEAKAQAYTGAASQKFRLTEAPLVLPGVQVMRTSTDPSKAVRAQGGSSTAGAAAQVASYSSDGSYNLLVQRKGESYAVRPVSSGCYLAASGASVKQVAGSTTWKAEFSTGGSRRGIMLVNQAGNAAMQVSGSSVNAKALAPSAAQSFLLSKATLMSSGYYNIVGSNGLLVDVSEGSFSNGANIQVHASNGSGAQVFYFEDIGGGVYLITSSKSYKALDVRGGGTAESTNVWQYAPNYTAAQLWVPVVDSAGRMTFLNVKSGKALTAAGTNVRINSADGSSNQHWTLTPTSQYSLTGTTALDRVLADILGTHTTLRSAYNYVAYSFSYRSGNKHWSGWSLSDSTSKDYALDMYRHGSGNCYRFASLFAWCARGLGYSNVVVRTGWVVGYSAPQAPHGWVTIDGYVYDPDMQHEASSRNWYGQTYASAPTAYYSW